MIETIPGVSTGNFKEDDIFRDREVVVSTLEKGMKTIIKESGEGGLNYRQYVQQGDSLVRDPINDTQIMPWYIEYLPYREELSERGLWN